MDIKNLIKIPVLIVVFFACLIGFSFATRVGDTDYKGTMDEPTLPVLMPYYKNMNMAKLYGYKTKIDDATCRKAIVPSVNDSIDIRIKKYGADITAGSYRINSLDGERFIAEGELDLSQVSEDNTRSPDSSLSAEKSSSPDSSRLPDNSDSPVQDLERTGFLKSAEDQAFIKTEIPCVNILENGEQYELIIELTVSGEPVWYYCRLLKGNVEYLDECISFARDFHRFTFDDSKLQNLSVYLEPDGTNAGSLAYVNIHSPISQIGWGDFQPEIIGDVTYNICEITDHYNIITVGYKVIEADDNGSIAYYDVREYYRMRYGVDVERCYLLDYERRMTEVFDTTGELFSSEGLIIGVNDEDIQCQKSVTGKMTSFVTGRDLWTYNADAAMLTCVFSFRNFDEPDDRKDHAGYEIMPLHTEEGGDTGFAVYGYMNRGVHEGETGIGIYRYDAMTDMVTEEMFMPVAASEDVIISNLCGRVYTNKNDISFMVYSGSIYRIDTAEGEVSTIVEDIDNTEVFFSAQAGKIVYQTEEGGDVHVFDMEKEEESVYETHGGGYIETKGFLNSDFVYAVKDDSIAYTGEGVRPYRELDIIGNAENRVIKTYKKDSVFITDIRIMDYMIELSCVKNTGGGYSDEYIDTIVNERGEDLIVDYRSFMNYGKKQQVALLGVGSIPSKKNLKTRRASEEILEELPVHSIRVPESFDYLVYAEGSCKLQTDRLSDAMYYADENAGVVILNTGMIWSRGKAGYVNPVYAEKVERIDRDDPVFETDGIRLEMALGFISGGYVLGIGEGENMSFLTGYDSTGVYFYNSEESRSEKKDMEIAKKVCAKKGNCFKIYSVK